ncbi:hypothetical protein D3C85_1344080 [compost metagenome]
MLWQLLRLIEIGELQVRNELLPVLDIVVKVKAQYVLAHANKIMLTIQPHDPALLAQCMVHKSAQLLAELRVTFHCEEPRHSLG